MNRKKQTILAISGVKNSGKTTLIEKLIPELAKRGIHTATIKHDGHCFEAERPGTDSYRHLAAGAMGTAVFDGEKFQLVKYAEMEEKHLIALFPEADLILLEGFKNSNWPKIEVVRKGISDTLTCDKTALLAVATDMETLAVDVPKFELDDVQSIAGLIESIYRL